MGCHLNHQKWHEYLNSIPGSGTVNRVLNWKAKCGDSQVTEPLTSWGRLLLLVRLTRDKPNHESWQVDMIIFTPQGHLILFLTYTAKQSIHKPGPHAVTTGQICNEPLQQPKCTALNRTKNVTAHSPKKNDTMHMACPSNASSSSSWRASPGTRLHDNHHQNEIDLLSLFHVN